MPAIPIHELALLKKRLWNSIVPVGEALLQLHQVLVAAFAPDLEVAAGGSTSLDLLH